MTKYSDQFIFPDFTCGSEDLRDYPGLLTNVQEGVVASACDGANHVAFSRYFTSVINGHPSGGPSSSFWGRLIAGI